MAKVKTVTVTAVAFTSPTNGDLVCVDYAKMLGFVKGTVTTDPGDPSRAQLYGLLFPGNTYGTAADLPMTPPHDCGPPLKALPDDDGSWVFQDVGPVKTGEPGNQFAVWAYGSEATVAPVRQLVSFKAQVKNQGVWAPVDRFNSISVTNPPSGSVYAVNNAPGVTSGTIAANGSAVVAGKFSEVYLRVYPGGTFAPGTVPQQPPAGCTQASVVGTGTSSSRPWSSSAVTNAAASCSCSTPYPPNQLVVWVWDSATSIYSVTLVNFQGKSANGC